jgi:ABC-type antimicrobial peptide transport system permease subunit
MRAGDIIRTATQNLGRRKVRTVLTSIGVFVGILTIVTMVSLGIGIQKQITDIIKQFGLETVFVAPKYESTPSGAFNPFARRAPEVPITSSAVERLRSMRGVESVEVFVVLPAAPEMSLTVGSKVFPVALREVDDPRERLFSRSETMLSGTALTNTPEARGVVISQRLARGVGYTPADYPGLVGKQARLTVTAPRGEQNSFNVTIAGVSNGVYGIDLGNADKLDLKKWWFNDPRVLDTDGYGFAVVHAAGLSDATRVSSEVEALGFGTATLQTVLDQVNRIFSILQVMLSSVGLLALLVASIGIINTMIMAIYERTREIGVLKALGSSSGDVLGLFMVEAGLIGLLGGVVGVLSGWGLGLALNRIIVEYMKSQQVPIDAPFFVITWDLVAEALLFSTFVGIAAGLYPALRAARLDPLAALRHE